MSNLSNTIRKAAATLAALGLATFLLTGCGGGGDSVPTPRPTPTPTPTPTPDPGGGSAGGGSSGGGQMTITPGGGGSGGAPRATADIPVLTLEVGETIRIDLSRVFTDPDGDELAWYLAFAQGYENNARAVVEGDYLYIEGVASPGTIVRVYAVDPDRNYTFQNITIIVQGGDSEGQAPRTQGSIPAQTLSVGETATIDLSRYFTDPDGDELTYRLIFSPGQEDNVSAAVSGDSLQIRGVASPGAVIRVFAIDPGRNQASQDISVRVQGDSDGQANQAPRAQGSIPEQTLSVGETDTVTLSTYFTDPDGDTLTYAYAIIQGESSVRIGGSGDSLQIRGVASPGAVIRVFAVDPGGDRASQDIAVRVQSDSDGQANRAPQAQGSIPEQTLSVGGRSEITLSNYFTDPDGDDLTYRYAIAPQLKGNVSAAVTGDSLQIQLVSAPRDARQIPVSVVATDPRGGQAYQSFHVRVQSANRSPQAQGSIPNQTLSVGGSVTITLSNYFTDPDGDDLTYGYDIPLSDRGNMRAAVTGDSLQIHGVASLEGARQVAATARDPSGAIAHQYFNVRVQSANRAPQARAIPNQTLKVGQSTTITLSNYFTDPDEGDELSYILTFGGGSASRVRASVSGDRLQIRGVASPGQVIRVTARDRSGASVYRDFQVAVSPSQYGALALGTDGRRYAWAFRTDESATAAERSAVNRCSQLLGSSCQRWGTIANGCRVIAVSECPSGCSRPAFGAASGSTRREAEREAIAACEDATSTITRGTCRVATGESGEPGAVCVGSE